MSLLAVIIITYNVPAQHADSQHYEQAEEVMTICHESRKITLDKSINHLTLFLY